MVSDAAGSRERGIDPWHRWESHPTYLPVHAFPSVGGQFRVCVRVCVRACGVCIYASLRFDSSDPTPTAGTGTDSKFGNVTHGIVLSASGLEAVVSSLARGRGML